LLVGLIIVIAILSGGVFLRINNLLNVLRQISVIGIIALGVTMCIITAGIDLSSGAVVAFVAVTVASLLQAADAMDRLYAGGHPWPVGLVLLIGLGAGTFIGFVNGAMISKLKIPPFIATLGMMTFARGWAFIYSQGRPRGSLIDSFQAIGQGNILGIPNPAIVLLVCVGITYVILQHTLWGVYTYARFLAGVAAIVLTARIGSGQPGLGLGYELDAIAASVIGGTSLAGGL